jgi:hypothetical protein
MYFLKSNRALITDSEIDREKEPHANLMTSDDNSYDEQARVVVVMVSPVVNAAHFVSKKASRLISEISYIAS